MKTKKRVHDGGCAINGGNADFCTCADVLDAQTPPAVRHTTTHCETCGYDKCQCGIPQKAAHTSTVSPISVSVGGKKWVSITSLTFDEAVKAVNMHEELVAALKEMRDRIPHRAGDCFSNDYMGACVCGRAIAEEVLAKVEGK